MLLIELQKKLGVEFKNTELLDEAFTHRSYLNEAGRKRNSNERLEFLGDAILSFIISDYLIKSYPLQPEGVLTNLRSTIVKTESLSEVSRDLKFGDYLYLSRGEEKSGGRSNISLLADTFEAFLGALYLDQGLTPVRAFLTRVILPRLPIILNNTLYADYKSRLQEIVQEVSQLPPIYKVVKTEGPDHAKYFWVTVVVDGMEKETGTGKSKQEAEQDAANKTLEKMGKTL